MSNSTTKATHLETRAVLAGAYRASLASTLTHLVEVDEPGGEVIRVWGCVKADNVADAEADDRTARPTCPKCAARFDRARR